MNIFGGTLFFGFPYGRVLVKLCLYQVCYRVEISIQIVEEVDKVPIIRHLGSHMLGHNRIG